MVAENRTGVWGTIAMSERTVGRWRVSIRQDDMVNLPEVGG